MEASLVRHPGAGGRLAGTQGSCSARIRTLAQIPVPATPLPGLAAEAGLTAYEAAYLWLVRSLGPDLVTLDRDLAEATGGEPVGS